ncbi:major antigen-like isoform X2 [Zophobas morio]|uniref:major antigen-like isoform X2 n=1 Tax=Zophobas morio TaxID=2755281 RepID=UPI003082B665
MILFEKILTVVENGNIAHNSTLSRQDLGRYQDYFRDIKQLLIELKLYISQNTRNFEQTEDSVCTITQRESALYLLSKENDRLKTAEKNFANVVKNLEIKKHCVKNPSMKKEISATEAHTEDTGKVMKSTKARYNEKLKRNPLLTDLELEDKTETKIQQQQMGTNKSYDRQHLEKINSDSDMKDKILEIEASMMSVSQNLQEILLEQLDKETSEIGLKIHEPIRNITQEVESKELPIKQNEAKLSDSKNKINEITREIEQLNAKMNTLNHKLITLHTTFAENTIRFLQIDKMDETVQEHENLVKNSERHEQQKIEGHQKELEKFESEAQKNGEQQQLITKDLTAEDESIENQNAFKSVKTTCNSNEKEIKRLTEVQKTKRAKTVSKIPVRQKCPDLLNLDTSKRSFRMNLELTAKEKYKQKGIQSKNI